jgi:gamma-glutamyltranspeptidase/glutathione hydrolase
LGCGRPLAGLLISALLLGACAQREPGVFEPVTGFAGVVTGDEPRAVLIGRDVLGNGGTAVDAAVAMYFAMAVTLPSRTSSATAAPRWTRRWRCTSPWR